MAGSQWKVSRVVLVPCPRCWLDLPAVTVTVDTRASGMRTLSMSVTVDELGDEWWRLARRGHPTCLPDDQRKVRRTSPGGFEVIDG